MLKTVEGSTRCQECEKFDAETRDLVLKLFGPEEVVLLTMMMANLLKDRRDLLNRMEQSDIQRLPVQRDLDMFSRTIGKLLVATDSKTRPGIYKSLRQRFGIVLDVSHEICPHKEIP